MYNPLFDNIPLWTHLQFDNIVAVREYLAIHRFLGDTTLAPHEKTPHEPPIIYIVKEELTLLVIPLTLGAHEANTKLHLQCKISALMGTAFKKQTTKNPNRR